MSCLSLLRADKFWRLKCPTRSFLGQNDQNKALAEAQAMAKLDHRAIVKIFKVYLLNSTTVQSVAIIMEYCDLGDLDKHLIALMDARQIVKAENVQGWMLSLLEALEYIHSKVGPLLCWRRICTGS